ncbi:MAG TPA: hypothetical protein PKD20_02585 [Candidatus Saccharibacteria bacterium]|nr:hypothetical protein [Candidatus Saccharibacteria bacterium]HMT55739.1 hypothetical protein [Candidatus Saccharibacteria bacterium]
MLNNTLNRITNAMVTDGYALTSYAELGLPFDVAAVKQMQRVVEEDVFDPDAQAGVDNLENMKSMIIARSKKTLDIGRAFVAPAVDLLLTNNPNARDEWELYGINRYDKIGATFEPHIDPRGRLVIVASATGARILSIYRRDFDQDEHKPETFRVIDHTVIVRPGDLFLIDGEFGPPHAVECLEAPSMSVVADVVGTYLRPV